MRFCSASMSRLASTLSLPNSAFASATSCFVEPPNSQPVDLTYELEKSGNAGFHAFIYTGGHFQDLNNLIPAGSGYLLTNAVGINNKGQILVDASTTSTFQNHALLLNRN
jgi:hypothetical protein